MTKEKAIFQLTEMAEDIQITLEDDELEPNESETLIWLKEQLEELLLTLEESE